MEILLILVLTPFVIVGGVILLSKGECYFCGHRFEEWDIVMKTEGKKTCTDCWVEVGMKEINVSGYAK